MADAGTASTSNAPTAGSANDIGEPPPAAHPLAAALVPQGPGRVDQVEGDSSCSKVAEPQAAAAPLVFEIESPPPHASDRKRRHRKKERRKASESFTTDSSDDERQGEKHERRSSFHFLGSSGGRREFARALLRKRFAKLADLAHTGRRTWSSDSAHESVPVLPAAAESVQATKPAPEEVFLQNSVSANPQEIEVDLAWTALWEEISCKGEVQADDEDRILACERWRRRLQGERHNTWFKIASTFRHQDWERLTTAIRSGVPAALRGSVWYACSGAATKKRETGRSYSDLVVAGKELKLRETESARLIEIDVPRTGVEGERRAALENVLLAFAAKNERIGYCQSMNFVAATLLLYNGEEQVFWMLCSLIEDLLPLDYYTAMMTGLRVDLRVLDSLVVEYLPNLHQHLTRLSIDLSPITMNWFLCLFVNTLPVEHSHRVMDALLHEGSKVLFRAGLSVLRIREDELLRAPSVMDAYYLLRAPYGVKDSSDLNVAPAATDDLLTSMFGAFLKGLSMDHILLLRQQHAAVIQAENDEMAARREALRMRETKAEKNPSLASFLAGVDDNGKGKPMNIGDRADDSGDGGALAADDPAESLRLRSLSLHSGVPTTPLGFAERAPDVPEAATTWLSLVTGDEVEEGKVEL